MIKLVSYISFVPFKLNYGVAQASLCIFMACVVWILFAPDGVWDQMQVYGDAKPTWGKQVNCKSGGGQL